MLNRSEERTGWLKRSQIDSASIPSGAAWASIPSMKFLVGTGVLQLESGSGLT